MMHVSVPLDSTIELIESTEISPLISKVKIKVCYVGDEPNRNKTIITKELAETLGPTLRGSPIVGYFNQDDGDFEQHNKAIEVNGKEFAIVDVTKPYGFVDLNAAVWFQKFLDDNAVEREYLCTEGYLWTTAYPECQRIIENGNNQSLEFDEKNFSGVWTKQDNSNARFFIINEAIIEKLCILGENYEPCFEGAQIKTEFSLDDQFAEMRKTMYSMVNDLHEVLKEGGNKVPTEYAVEIGSSLFDAIWDKMWSLSGNYRIKGVYEEDLNNLKELLENMIDVFIKNHKISKSWTQHINSYSSCYRYSAWFLYRILCNGEIIKALSCSNLFCHYGINCRFHCLYIY